MYECTYIQTYIYKYKYTYRYRYLLNWFDIHEESVQEIYTTDTQKR